MTRSADEPQVVDARGMRCPWPVLRAARAMREWDHVVLIADDPMALRDVPAIAAERGWHCTVSEQPVGAQFTIKKTPETSHC